MNDHQQRLWSHMVRLIQDFHAGRIQFSELVGELAGAFEAADFRDRELGSRWYRLWAPLEIRRAVQGDDADRNAVKQELQEIEELLALFPGQE